MIEPTLRLSIITDDGEKCLQIRIINFKRMTLHGFGLFLENFDPEEVVAGKGVIDALCAQPERRGLQGVEFWGDAKRLAFCAEIVPLRNINVPEGAKDWIRKFKVE